MNGHFLEGIYRNLAMPAEHICCCIEDQKTTYSEFATRVAAIQQKIEESDKQAIGVATQNHVDTYAALIACWMSGKAYVPINTSYPTERIQSIAEESGLDMVLFALNTTEIAAVDSQFTNVQFIETHNLTGGDLHLVKVSNEQNAYILFTSGTTGKPKGVPIGFDNLQAFLEGYDALQYQVTEEDRFLQMFELTFDLSVMCFTVPLLHGASFYTLPANMIKTLALYHVLETYEITFSLMVPSGIQLLLPYLEDIYLPNLRVSQFCGEALKVEMATKWSNCIPNAVIDNVYGPTEATIYCTSYRLNLQHPEVNSYKGVVVIGKAMQWVETGVFQENLLITDVGQPGELCVAGAQITRGYLLNPAQNESRFFQFNGKRFYKTGDMVQYDENQNLVYLGRSDDQVKIQGYRIELMEIESAAQRVLKDTPAVAVAYTDSQENHQIVLFIQNATVPKATILEGLKTILPAYMLPQHVISIERIPLNGNGKTDRNQLRDSFLTSSLRK